MHDPILSTTLMVIFAILYFIPAINAKGRNHRNSGSIFLTNLLLGWTALGWIIALIWSASADVAPAPVPAITR